MNHINSMNDEVLVAASVFKCEWRLYLGCMILDMYFRPINGMFYHHRCFLF